MIWEGDIVRQIRPNMVMTIGTVVFKGGCFTIGEAGWYFWDYAAGDSDTTIEILGNVHENPELLK